MIERRGEYSAHSSPRNALKRKQTKTYGLVFSRRSLGRVGRFSSQPCPINGPTATR